MKHIILIICVVAASCCSTKKSVNEPPKKETTEVQNPLLKSIPLCIRQMIEKFKSEEKQNPPRKIMSYTYRDKTVYYVTAPCCDFYSDLYDDNCKLLGHPDGGITGKGDGKLPDFEKARSNENLIWEDKR
jgi:hypothetical protein